MCLRLLAAPEAHCKTCLLPSCCRTQTCRFSGLKIYPGKGIFFVRTDGQVSLRPCCFTLDSSNELGAGQSRHQGLHGAQQAACDRQSHLQGPTPTSSLLLSAELPVPKQENKALVSPAEEACKDCMDGHIQEAASQGQLGGCMRSARCSVLLTCRRSCLLAAGLGGGWACCAQRALQSAHAVLSGCGYCSQFPLSGNSCLLPTEQSGGRQL